MTLLQPHLPTDSNFHPHNGLSQCQRESNDILPYTSQLIKSLQTLNSPTSSQLRSSITGFASGFPLRSNHLRCSLSISSAPASPGFHDDAQQLPQHPQGSSQLAVEQLLSLFPIMLGTIPAARGDVVVLD